jgi:intron-binding protein aquarius
MGYVCSGRGVVTIVRLSSLTFRISDLLQDRPAEFSDLFRRALSMSLESSLSWTIRTHILQFIIHAFQSLDCGIVRKECAPLVSISIWHNLSTEQKRNELLADNSQLRKAWRAAAKRYDSADDATKIRLRFERSWLFTLILDCLALLNTVNTTSGQYIVVFPCR